jgi:hypothetical protein
LISRAVLVAVREASRAGRLASLADVREAVLARLAETPQGPPEADALTDDALDALLAAHPGLARFHSLEGHTLYHAPSLLSRTYARILDRKGSPSLLMAEEIRVNSHDYPRPVPVELFETEPFNLGREAIKAALTEFDTAPEFADISLVETANGATFLFSERFLPRAYAQFLADQADSLALNP